MKENKLSCKGCKHIKCYAILYQNYYCDHQGRTDDMGKLTQYNLNTERPIWCPCGKEETLCLK